MRYCCGCVPAFSSCEAGSAVEIGLSQTICIPQKSRSYRHWICHRLDEHINNVQALWKVLPAGCAFPTEVRHKHALPYQVHMQRLSSQASACCRGRRRRIPVLENLQFCTLCRQSTLLIWKPPVCSRGPCPRDHLILRRDADQPMLYITAIQGSEAQSPSIVLCRTGEPSWLTS